MYLYCIYDKKAELANPPFSMPNHAMAIRNFQMQVNRPGSESQPNVLALYASDFALYYLGSLDDKSCNFTPSVPILELSTAKQLLTPPQESSTI